VLFFGFSHDNLDLRSIVLTPDYLFAADTGKRCIYRLNMENAHSIIDRELRFESSIAQFKPDYNLMFGSPPGMHMHFEWMRKDIDVFDGFVVYAAPITMTFSTHSGLLYIANPGRHRVDVFTQDGIYQPELSFGEPSGRLEGFPACCNPIGLAVLDDGRILTVEKGISRIKIYRTDGTLDTVVAGPDVLDNLPPEMKRTPLEPGGRYFSAVPLTEERIAVFDYEGLIRTFAPL